MANIFLNHNKLSKIVVFCLNYIIKILISKCDDHKKKCASMYVFDKFNLLLLFIKYSTIIYELRIALEELKYF